MPTPVQLGCQLGPLVFWDSPRLTLLTESQSETCFWRGSSKCSSWYEYANPNSIGRQMAACGKQVWDCWKFRLRWNLRVFIPRLLRVTTTHSMDRISIWNLYLLAWTLFSSWYKYANPSLIRPQMAACRKLEWNFQKSRLRQNLHVLITHLRRVTTAHSIDRIALWNLFIYSSWCKCEWPSSIVPHCKSIVCTCPIFITIATKIFRSN